MFSIASDWIVFILVGAVFYVVVYIAIASRRSNGRQGPNDKK
jgi:hypothetical protein